MSDSDEAITLPDGTVLTRIRKIHVLPHMVYMEDCPKGRARLGRYIPSFPLFMNDQLQGVHCGSCITDLLEESKKRDPTIKIYDGRFAVKN